MGLGLVISALSTLVTVVAVYACHNGTEKASAWWVIATYAVITVGELCLSPMGLSMVSKMVPARLAGLMMGGWQLATSLGNKLSGVLATMWDKYVQDSLTESKTSHFSPFFTFFQLRSSGYAPSKMQKLTKNQPVFATGRKS